MNWPYKSIVSFVDAKGTRFRVRYVVSATCLDSARGEVERLLVGDGVSDCNVEAVAPVTAEEQRRLNLPAGRIQIFR
jgi:hypothetical protein